MMPQSRCLGPDPLLQQQEVGVRRKLPARQQAQRSHLLRMHWQQATLQLLLAVLLGQGLVLTPPRQTTHPGGQWTCWALVVLLGLLQALAAALHGYLHMQFNIHSGVLRTWNAKYVRHQGTSDTDTCMPCCSETT
jgi:hypothetical protein